MRAQCKRPGSLGSVHPCCEMAQRPDSRSQDEVPGPFPGGRQWPVAFSQNLPLLAAILVIEFIYAIVGIVWLTQYYTSCNDLTAKNVTLGMHPICPISKASPRVEVIGPSLQRKGLRRHSRETPSMCAPFTQCSALLLGVLNR